MTCKYVCGIPPNQVSYFNASSSPSRSEMILLYSTGAVPMARTVHLVLTVPSRRSPWYCTVYEMRLYLHFKWPNNIGPWEGVTFSISWLWRECNAQQHIRLCNTLLMEGNIPTSRSPSSVIFIITTSCQRAGNGCVLSVEMTHSLHDFSAYWFLMSATSSYNKSAGVSWTPNSISVQWPFRGLFDTHLFLHNFESGVVDGVSNCYVSSAHTATSSKINSLDLDGKKIWWYHNHWLLNSFT